MAADTYSALMGLLLQATGNNNNNWGDKFNASVANIIDRGFRGVNANAVTGGTLDFSTGTQPPAGVSTMVDFIQKFTGALTSQQVVILPPISGHWVIWNVTTGNQTLVVKTATSNPIEIPQGTLKHVVSDGGANVMRLDRDNIGTVEYKAAGSAFPGRILCSGQSLLRTDYPYLFSLIGTTYGAVDGTHFNVPNLTDTGRFIRSTSSILTAGTYQSYQVGTHSHSFSGTTATENASHAHFVSGTTSAMSANSSFQPTFSEGVIKWGNFQTYTSGGALISIRLGAGSDGSFYINPINIDHTHTWSATTGTENVAHAHTFSGTTASAGGGEVRPEAVAMVATIVV